MRLGGEQIGPYRVVGELGRGGMGAVFRAVDQGGREVALKLATGAMDATRRERFLREGQLAARLDHPGIVQVHAAGEHGGRPWLAYELVRDARPIEEAFPERTWVERVELIVEVCQALAAAHAAGVVHRDIKPDNVLIDGEGRVRIADFGLATAGDLDRLTLSGIVVGTPLFLSPEAFAGEGTRSPTFDVWSLGVLLYLAVTGSYPFEAENLMALADRLQSPPPSPRSLQPELPLAVERIVLRALAYDPAERFADAGALGAALEEWLAGAAPAGRQQRHLRALALLAGVTVPVAIGVALLGGASSSGPSTSGESGESPGAAPSPSASAQASGDPAASPVRAKPTALLERPQRILAAALHDGSRAYDAVLALCRQELQEDIPSRELLLGSEPPPPEQVPELLRRWDYLYRRGDFVSRWELTLLCDLLVRAGCLEPLMNLAQRMRREPLFRQTDDLSLKADAERFTRAVLEACVLRGASRAAQVLAREGDSAARAYYDHLLAVQLGRGTRADGLAELLTAWRPLSQRAPAAWVKARQALAEGELAAAFASYRQALPQVRRREREQLLLELATTLDARLSRAAKAGRVSDPADRADLEWALEQIECPRLLIGLAQRQAAEGAGRGVLDQERALGRAMQTVERGLAWQPDEWRLWVLRAELFWQRSKLRGNPADIERALEAAAFVRTIMSSDNETAFEQQMRRALGK